MKIFAAMVAICVAGSVAAGARAQDQVTAPDWIRKPTSANLRAVYPTEALRNGLSGRAVIQCEISVQGTLYACRTLEEDPPGSGFGAAAIMMAPQFLMRPQTRNGQPVAGGSIRIPIKFDLAGSERSLLADVHTMVPPNMAWEQAPTRADVVAVYPDKAKAAGVTGLVGLQCNFNYLRTLSDCRVMREEPLGYGFGKAAQKLSKTFVAPPLKPGGKPLSEASVQLSVVFAPDLLKPNADVGGTPNWPKLPSDEALDRAFAGMSPDAKAARVKLRCTVEQGGALSGCRTISEEPAGQGLGDRALMLAPDFRLSTWSMDGLPVVGGDVNIPLAYRREEPAAPAKP